MRHFPPVSRGLRIGLLGGSFDPPHAGHVHITQVALRAFELDRIWWLVTPGNPLKERGPAALDRRLAACRELMAHPRVTVTDIESRIGTRYTADTLSSLQKLYPGARFVWLMGADNLIGFHRWEHWSSIMETVPIGVLARPGAQLRAGLSPAAQRYRNWRLRQELGPLLPFRKAPCWTLVTGPMSRLSSTAIRQEGRW